MANTSILKSGGVPSNYAILLASILFFPLSIFAIFYAETRRADAVDWEQTHHEMQYRTAVAYLVFQAILLGVRVSAALVFGADVPAEMTRLVTFQGVLKMISYVPHIWLAVRCVRGLFLAGSKTPLVKPRSYTVWPQ